MQAKVNDFLIEFKRIASKNGIYLVPRNDSFETLRYLNLTKRNLEEILLGLTIADYCVGPESDHSGQGEVWVFGLDFDGLELYIKLKIVNEEMVKCMSFHICVHPLTYPLRGVKNPGSREGEVK